MSTDDELYNLAREIDDAVTAVHATARQVHQAPVEVRLPGELGTIVVTGAGELQRIDLEPDEVRNYTPDGLAQQLLAGIRHAERAAAERRSAAIAAATAKEHLQ